jgi:hypothetical protein
MNPRLATTRLSLTLAALLAALIFPAAHASIRSDLSGQWVGNSQVDGATSTAQTTLTLGAPDSNNSSMRIEGRRTCFLKQGSYTLDGDSDLTLTFKYANGSEACNRLAKGKFKVHHGSVRNALVFEVAYADARGGKAIRRGALSRYP